MQLEEIQIPIYFGGFIDVFWDSDGIIRVDTERDRLSICANGPALAALAKQLLYFSCNNSLRHAHVHYDSFFCKNGYVGEPLILEFSPREETRGFDLYDDDTVTLRLDIPSDCEPDVPGLLQVFPEECRIVGDRKDHALSRKGNADAPGQRTGMQLVVSFRQCAACRALPDPDITPRQHGKENTMKLIWTRELDVQKPMGTGFPRRIFLSGVRDFLLLQR